MGAEREEMRLRRLRPHRPAGQCGETGREVGVVGGDEPGTGVPLASHTLQKEKEGFDYELAY